MSGYQEGEMEYTGNMIKPLILKLRLLKRGL